NGFGAKERERDGEPYDIKLGIISGLFLYVNHMTKHSLSGLKYIILSLYKVNNSHIIENHGQELCLIFFSTLRYHQLFVVLHSMNQWCYTEIEKLHTSKDSFGVG